MGDDVVPRTQQMTTILSMAERLNSTFLLADLAVWGIVLHNTPV